MLERIILMLVARSGWWTALSLLPGICELNKNIADIKIWKHWFNSQKYNQNIYEILEISNSTSLRLESQQDCNCYNPGFYQPITNSINQ